MYSHEYNIYITLAYNAHLKSQFGRSRNYGTADAVGALCVCVCVYVCVFGRQLATPSRSISPVKVATGKVYL